MNIDRDGFLTLLKKHARVLEIAMNDEIFGGGIDISSLRFTEFIMDIEEEFGIDIDVDDLDSSIRTVDQLFDRISRAK